MDVYGAGSSGLPSVLGLLDILESRRYPIPMETLHLTTIIGPDRKLRIETVTDLEPGPAQVVIVISPEPAARDDDVVDWSDWYAIDKDLWAGIDAQVYVNRLRDEWE